MDGNIFFPVKIEKRKKPNIVNFIESIDYRFIIEASKNSDIRKLLSWKKDYVERFTNGDTEWSFYAEEESGEEEMEISIILTVGKKTSQNGNPLMEETEEEFGLSINFNESIEKIKVSFLLENSGIRTQGTCLIFYLIKQQDRYISGALDFGSEASQIIQIDNREKITSILKPSVMGDLLSSLHSDDQNKFDFEAYIQSSKEDDLDKDKFLKSLFFYETKNARKDDGIYPSQMFFKFLTKENEISKLFEDSNLQCRILPNLKIAYLNSEYFVKFGDGSNLKGEGFVIEAKKLILSNLIEALINYNLNQNEKLYLHFTLLYPNVYNQRAINKIYSETKKIFEEKEKKKKIKGFEISLLSESDAVFLGVRQKYREKIKKNKTYVIIDSGKGTTDYSVVTTGNGDLDYSISFRTGFVGAGNLITFSILISLISDIATEKDLKFEEVSKKLIGEKLKTSDFYKISHVLNKLKVNFDENFTQNFKNLDLENLDILNVLENLNGVEDNGGYIDASIDFIITKIKKDINPYVNKDTVFILSGRTFRFKKLIDRLKAELHPNKVEYITQVPKTISLLGAFSGVRQSGNCVMEGIPQDISNQLYEDSTKELNKNNIFSIKSKLLESKLVKLLMEKQNVEQENDFFLEEGKTVELKNLSKVICSNTIYSLPEDLNEEWKSKNSDGTDSRIFFNGLSLAILCNKRVFNLKEDYDVFGDIEKLLNRYSIFPFIEDEKQFLNYVIDFEKFLKENSSGSEEKITEEDFKDIFG